MARTVRDVRLDSRAARERLEPRKKPYFRVIEAGRHVGYYKGSRGGSWLARTGEAGRYHEKKLGSADDVRDANGIDVLSFSQAQAAARDWFDQLAREQDALGDATTKTVRSAVESYIKARDAKEAARQGRAVKSSAAHKLKLHVLANDELADMELQKLTAAALRKWRAELPGTAASRQRITNDFKAALNEAAPSAAVRVAIKEGLASPKNDAHEPHDDDAAGIENKILTDDETRRLLKAVRDRGDDDLYRLCLVLASTGARFAQVRRLKVRDVQVQRGRIMMPASHKGRVGSQARPAVPVPVGSDVLDALAPVIKGRKAGDPLLERWRHVQSGSAQWVRDRRGLWLAAAELARPLRASVTAAELPASASAYSFRHSSIVRALREGLPVRLVAQLHDTSIQMIERNYTRFMAHALEELARKAIVPMVAQDHGDNVVSLSRHKEAAGTAGPQ
jgi:integrase